MKLSNNMFLVLVATMGISGVYGMNNEFQNKCQKEAECGNLEFIALQDKSHKEAIQKANGNLQAKELELTNLKNKVQRDYFLKELVFKKNSFSDLFFEHIKSSTAKKYSQKFYPFSPSSSNHNDIITFESNFNNDTNYIESLRPAIENMYRDRGYETVLVYKNENNNQNEKEEQEQNGEEKRIFHDKIEGFKAVETIIHDKGYKAGRASKSSIFPFGLGCILTAVTMCAVQYHKPIYTFASKFINKKNNVENDENTNDENNDSSSEHNTDSNAQE